MEPRHGRRHSTQTVRRSADLLLPLASVQLYHKKDFRYTTNPTALVSLQSDQRHLVHRKLKKQKIRFECSTWAPPPFPLPPPLPSSNLARRLPNTCCGLCQLWPHWNLEGFVSCFIATVSRSHIPVNMFTGLFSHNCSRNVAARVSSSPLKVGCP